LTVCAMTQALRKDVRGPVVLLLRLRFLRGLGFRRFGR
jgi:hypothetical protein